MRNFLFFFVAALLIIPGITLAQQNSTQESQVSNASSDTLKSKDKTQAGQSADANAQTVTGADAGQDSLAAAARRAKDQKKSGPKPKVFTNDDLGGASSTASTKDKAEASAAADAKSAANDEKTWREKFATLRHKLEQDQADLDVMQRELGQLNMQYYSDPVKAMQQQYTRSDINDKTAQIEAKKKAIDADQQAISDAEDDLRKAGGDPGWAR